MSVRLRFVLSLLAFAVGGVAWVVVALLVRQVLG